MNRCCTLVAEKVARQSMPLRSPDADMTRLVAVVAHTHWDREWYAPYEHFRARLAGVLDEVLAHAGSATRRFGAFSSTARWP